MAPSLTSLLLPCSLASLSLYGNKSLPPGLLHVAWATHSMVVSKQSPFLISCWLPSGDKWMLPGHLRATHRTGIASCLPSCIGQSSHRPVQIQRGIRHHFLMEGMPNINQPHSYSPVVIIPVQYFYNFFREFAFHFLKFLTFLKLKSGSILQIYLHNQLNLLTSARHQYGLVWKMAIN